MASSLLGGCFRAGLILGSSSTIDGRIYIRDYPSQRFMIVKNIF